MTLGENVNSFYKIITIVFFILSQIALASLTSVKLNSKTQVPQTRWIFDTKSKSIKASAKKLALIKLEYQKGNFAQCSKLASDSFASQKLIQPWVLAIGSECEIEAQARNKKISVGKARVLIQQINNRKDWLLFGPYSRKLKNNLIELQALLVEWEIKNRPQLAFGILGNLLDYQDWMTSSQKARAYQMAGELSFLQQNLVDAKAYILKSLDEIENPKLRERLTAIESALSKTTPEQAALLKNEIISAGTLGGDEQKIVLRMTQALTNGDLFSAAKDGMELIENYPGSVHADWAAQRIIDSFMTISVQDADKYKALKYDFLGVMKDADVARLLDWSRKIFKAGFYKDSLVLLKEAYSKASGVIYNVELVDLLAKSYMHTRDYSRAEDYFSEITKKYSGTKESVEAYFYMGLVNYMGKKYSKAQSLFEKVLAQTQYTEHELSSRYWLWRTSQKIDVQRAQQEAQILVSKFPFSYYGLLAIADQNKGAVDFNSLNKPVKAQYEMWLSPRELDSWKRLQVLLESGWYEEASQELAELPMPNTADGQALLARYFAAAMDYPKAIRMINKGWDEKSDLRVMPFVDVAFPKEFIKTIESQSAQYKLNPLLVLSLIRQESSFNTRAVSTSGALGLMQMIPPTAKDVAQALKIKDLELPLSMYNPDTNIKMGTYYIAKMIKDFESNVPFALAAYNAGPTKVKRWLSASGVKPQLTSSPEYEVWFDLLPWSETRFYIKAILRNYLIYQLVNMKPVQVKDPVWGQSEG